ncbi:doublecortin domain-containing protein 2-like [Xyrichtys novacula]|uniref:Doublecortin domain-containing protein 2 n=1 Tax=Xyrichtys novacula TaxID=13765 RepID=A0AAV1FNA4_XYRNO|nr:doublecortin domain-containing protein 2-like [Xyrichtys novacula]
MSSEKPNFLSQPVVKNVFMYRNGDPYFEARRIVINQKRVSNFETLLREVTGGIQAPFGAVRNIYTPRGGHKVDSLETLQSGEQYVAAGRERFKRLDYLHIGSRKKRMMQTLPMQVKPLPPNRIIVSARFLKPIKEPCTVFVVANGDVLNPAMRLLIHQRMLSQFDKILEMITEKMGLRVLGGVRSLYTYEGQQVTDGHQMESGQLYVAVGREKFKKLPYSDLLFTKPRGTRRINGMKAFSLPPIHRFSKQNGNAKSTVRCSDSGEGDSKAFPPANTSNNKEHLSSIVREISQARLISLRKKRSGQSMTLSITDNDELEAKADDGNSEDNPPQEQPAEEKPADDETKAAEEKGEKEGEGKMEAADKNTSEETSGDEEKKNEDTSVEKEKEATVGAEEKKVEEEIKKEVRDEGKEEVKSEEQGSSSSNGDTTLESKEKEDEGHEGEKLEHDTNIKEEGQDKESEQREESSKDQVNDVDTGEEEKETENSSDPEKTQSDNDTKENRKERGSSGNSNQDEDASTTKELGEEEKMVNGEISGEDDEVESEAELDLEEKKTASGKEGMENTAKEQRDKKENKIQSSKEKE